MVHPTQYEKSCLSALVTLKSFIMSHISQREIKLCHEPQKPFKKAAQRPTVEAVDSQFEALGEKPKWTRPGHTIEKNLEASIKGK